jgi:radical SAM superfamily enzyme YgiQ (UPF0313 family)
MMRKKLVVLINPLEKSIQLDLISSRHFMPRYGTIAIATALKNAGYNVKVFCEFCGSKIDWKNVYSADYICFSLLSFCSFKGYKYADMIKKKYNTPIIFGGSHASVLPEDCLKHCDFVVRNEGEETLIDLLNVLENDGDPKKVKGISYKDEREKIIHNPNRNFMKSFDSAIDPSLIGGYRPLKFRDKIKNFLLNKPVSHMPVIQTSRGCPYNCTFCFARRELGNKYRTKNINFVIQDMKNTMRIFKNNYFLIVDNDFTINREHTKKLLRKIIKEFDSQLHFSVFARIEISDDIELLELMRKAGVDMVMIGVESLNEKTLIEFNKKQTVEKIKNSIKIIRSCGLQILPCIVFGSENDTLDSIRSAVKFCLNQDFKQICFYPVYDFPTQTKVLGTPQLFPDYRFIHMDWRFFTGNFVIHYPKKIKPSTLQKEIIDAYKKFYSRKKTLKRIIKYGDVNEIDRFYSMKLIIKTMEQYARLLEVYEDGLYDENDNLMEKKLHDRPTSNKIPFKKNGVVFAEEIFDFLFKCVTKISIIPITLKSSHHKKIIAGLCAKDN